MSQKLVKLKKNDHKHYECITTQECNKLTSQNFDAKLNQANLARKNDIANLVNKYI